MSRLVSSVVSAIRTRIDKSRLSSGSAESRQFTRAKAKVLECWQASPQPTPNKGFSPSLRGEESGSSIVLASVRDGSSPDARAFLSAPGSHEAEAAPCGGSWKGSTPGEGVRPYGAVEGREQARVCVDSARRGAVSRTTNLDNCPTQRRTAGADTGDPRGDYGAVVTSQPEPERGTPAPTTNRRGVDGHTPCRIRWVTNSGRPAKLVSNGSRGAEERPNKLAAITGAAGIKPGRRLVVGVGLVAVLLRPTFALGASGRVSLAADQAAFTPDAHHPASLPKANVGLPLALYGGGTLADYLSTGSALKAGARENNPWGQSPGSRIALSVGSTLGLTAGDVWLQKRSKLLTWTLRGVATVGYGYLTLRNISNAKAQRAQGVK